MELILDYPLLYCILLATVLCACLFLFISVKRDLWRTEVSLHERVNGVERETGHLGEQCAALRSAIADCARRTRDTEEKIELLSPLRHGQSFGPGIDTNHRTQVLRRARRGDRPEQVAAELQLPRNEVELLYKVHRAVAGSL